MHRCTGYSHQEGVHYLHFYSHFFPFFFGQMKIRSRKEIRAFVGQKKDIGVTIFFPGKKKMKKTDSGILVSNYVHQGKHFNYSS